jgi:hypothetical protein
MMLAKELREISSIDKESNMKNKILVLAVVTASAVFCTSAMAAPAHLANQGHEAGLEGWISSGDVTATSESIVATDIRGWAITSHQTQMAQLNSNSTHPQGLEIFFGLNIGTLGTVLVGDMTHGAGIKQSFTGLAGDTLTQYWDFVSRGYTSFNDSAFVVVNGQVTVLASVENGGIEVGDYGHTGWQSFSYTLPAEGTYTVGFGVVNMQDTALDSVLFLDNQAGGDRALPVIPEPGTYAMLLAGLALISVMTKRKSLSATSEKCMRSHLLNGSRGCSHAPLDRGRAKDRISRWTEPNALLFRPVHHVTLAFTIRQLDPLEGGRVNISLDSSAMSRLGPESRESISDKDGVASPFLIVSEPKPLYHL